MMSENLDIVIEQGVVGALPPDDVMLQVERRIFRGMYIALALGVPFAFAFAEWRTGTGLLLGGLLALMNYRWMQSSISSAFNSVTDGTKPNLTVTRYFLRYVVIASVIFAAHTLGIASAVWALFGLSLFAVAALAEAFVQVYFAIIQKEN
jgi:hypothetical protein